jgi:hypothetical protein
MAETKAREAQRIRSDRQPMPGDALAIAINLDGTLAATAGSVPGLTTRPAAVGDSIVILTCRHRSEAART